MAKYYIHTDDGDESYRDSEGFDFAELQDARRAALSALPDMARDVLPDGDRRTFVVSVEDERGGVVYRATLDLVGEWKIDAPPELLPG